MNIVSWSEAGGMRVRVEREMRGTGAARVVSPGVGLRWEGLGKYESQARDSVDGQLAWLRLLMVPRVLPQVRQGTAAFICRISFN